MTKSFISLSIDVTDYGQHGETFRDRAELQRAVTDQLESAMGAVRNTFPDVEFDYHVEIKRDLRDK